MKTHGHLAQTHLFTLAKLVLSLKKCRLYKDEVRSERERILFSIKVKSTILKLVGQFRGLNDKMWVFLKQNGLEIEYRQTVQNKKKRSEPVQSK